MVDLDKALAEACDRFGGLYQRYSDDILIICPLDKELEILEKLKASVAAHKLEIKAEKTERAIFGDHSDEIFQYLGFNVSRKGATIRTSSLALQNPDDREHGFHAIVSAHSTAS
jgi:hypothetical protein